MKKGLFFLIFIPFFSFSQIIGSWNEYFSYNNVIQIAENSDNQFFALSDNGFFVYKNGQIIDKISKINGLSDVGLSAIGFSKEFNALICGYSNGNIDIIQNNSTKNLPYIKNKNLSIDKTINQIICYEDNAFLCSNFGIIRIDLNTLEISETYILAQSGYNKVFSAIIWNNKILSATENGLYWADLNTNLVDFDNWEKDLQLSDFQVIKLTIFNNKPTALIWNGNNYEIKIYANNVWENFQQFTDVVVDIYGNNQFLVVGTQTKVSVYNSTGLKINEFSSIAGNSLNINTVFISEDNKIYGGDKFLGLIDFAANDFIFPSAPLSNNIFRMEFENDKLYCVNGGYFQDYSPKNLEGEIYILDNGNWQNLKFHQYKDFCAIAVDKQNPNHFFVGSWQDGLIEISDNQVINVFNPQNSSLNYYSGNTTRISFCKFDKKGNLWAGQPAYEPLHCYSQGIWTAYDFNNIFNPSYTPTEITFLDENSLVFSTDFRGFIALNTNGTENLPDDDIYFHFLQKDNESQELIGTHINTIAKDKEGIIWFGGTDGIGIITDLDIENQQVVVSRIKITTTETDTAIINYLLKGSYITKILIDPANRKWIGTNKGLYLVNEYGTEQIYYFNDQNSPLPSSQIVDLAINPRTGELFIATSKGLVSIYSDATEGSKSYENAYVYPNPVNHDYEGQIIIKGLKEETYVKITDIAGNLVYETKSNGGIAVWDGKNLSGQKVQTGVYLIFLTTSDRTESKVLKLLVIH